MFFVSLVNLFSQDPTEVGKCGQWSEGDLTTFNLKLHKTLPILKAKSIFIHPSFRFFLRGLEQLCRYFCPRFSLILGWFMIEIQFFCILWTIKPAMERSNPFWSIPQWNESAKSTLLTQSELRFNFVSSTYITFLRSK